MTSSSNSDVPDDREEFQLRQSQIALEMWRDDRVRELDRELTEVSDRHEPSRTCGTGLASPSSRTPVTSS